MSPTVRFLYGEMAAEIEAGPAAKPGLRGRRCHLEDDCFLSGEGASEAREIEEGRVSRSISLKAPFIN